MRCMYVSVRKGELSETERETERKRERETETETETERDRENYARRRADAHNARRGAAAESWDHRLQLRDLRGGRVRRKQKGLLTMHARLVATLIAAAARLEARIDKELEAAVVERRQGDLLHTAVRRKKVHGGESSEACDGCRRVLISELCQRCTDDGADERSRDSLRSGLGRDV